MKSVYIVQIWPLAKPSFARLARPWPAKARGLGFNICAKGFKASQTDGSSSNSQRFVVEVCGSKNGHNSKLILVRRFSRPWTVSFQETWSPFDASWQASSSWASRQHWAVRWLAVGSMTWKRGTNGETPKKAMPRLGLRHRVHSRLIEWGWMAPTYFTPWVQILQPVESVHQEMVSSHSNSNLQGCDQSRCPRHIFGMLCTWRRRIVRVKIQPPLVVKCQPWLATQFSTEWTNRKSQISGHRANNFIVVAVSITGDQAKLRKYWNVLNCASNAMRLTACHPEVKSPNAIRQAVGIDGLTLSEIDVWFTEGVQELHVIIHIIMAFWVPSFKRGPSLLTASIFIDISSFREVQKQSVSSKISSQEM